MKSKKFIIKRNERFINLQVILKNNLSLFILITILLLFSFCKDSSSNKKSHKIKDLPNNVEHLLFQSDFIGEQNIIVSLPKDYNSTDRALKDKKYPLLILFSGRGEAIRSNYEGALGWVQYYSLPKTLNAIRRGQVTKNDFFELVTDEMLIKYNNNLEAKPYEEMVIACPKTPDLNYMISLDDKAYDNFISKELIKILEDRYRIDKTKIGVDGVSLGGVYSCYFGLKYPDIFSSWGSIQGATTAFMEIFKALVDKNKEKINKQKINIVTSTDDYLKVNCQKLHQFLENNGIKHRFVMLQGPHDYIFNRGPGAIDMLIFHNDALNYPHN